MVDLVCEIDVLATAPVTAVSAPGMLPTVSGTSCSRSADLRGGSARCPLCPGVGDRRPRCHPRSLTVWIGRSLIPRDTASASRRSALRGERTLLARRNGCDRHRGLGRGREVTPHVCERLQGRDALGREGVVGRLRGSQPERRDAQADEETGSERARDGGPAEDGRDHGGPERRVRVVGLQVWEERNPAPVDPRPEQLEDAREGRDRCSDRAGDHRDRRGRQAVEGRGVDEEDAGHRDDHGRPGDDHRPAGGTRCHLERLVRGEAAASLLARADHVEERVVDADGHADQDQHDPDGVVDVEQLADRALERRTRRRQP